jgi:hypothetical protein
MCTRHRFPLLVCCVLLLASLWCAVLVSKLYACALVQRKFGSCTCSMPCDRIAPASPVTELELLKAA